MGNKAANEPLISDKTLRTFVGYHLCLLYTSDAADE